MLPYALCAFGMPHRMGFLPTRSGAVCAEPLGLLGLVEAAHGLGLRAVEMPLPEPQQQAGLLALLQARGMHLIPAYGQVLDRDSEHLRSFLSRAAQLGAPVVRAVLSGVLCGDRRAVPGGWEAHLSAVAARLRDVLPCAEALGVCIAVENHQDVGSADLLRLAELVDFSPSFGITLDTGNPLAVGEEPCAFTERIAPLIRHVHLKDYTLHFCPEGYRLVRCPAGAGIIDFSGILEFVSRSGNAPALSIEIAAQQTRTIPILQPDWWACYAERSLERFLPVLRLLWREGRPAGEPYGSAWELGADSATVCAEEWECVLQSVDYFRAQSFPASRSAFEAPEVRQGAEPSR